jgi:hypothetical protein
MSLNHPDTPMRVLAMTLVSNIGVGLRGASRERIDARGRSSQKARSIALHWAMWCKRRQAALATVKAS